MNKQMAIGLIALILFSGVGIGYLMGQYSINPDLSIGSASTGGRCVNEGGTAKGCGRYGLGDSGGATACALAHNAYDNTEKCHWQAE